MPTSDTSETVLIVDDDQSVTASLALLLQQAGYCSVAAESPVVALALLREQQISLVIQDMNFSRQTTGEEGLELLSEIRKISPLVPVILLTAWGSISLAVKGVKAGATDFVTKPWDNHQLLRTVETAMELAAKTPEPTLNREQLDERFDFNRIVGRDPELLRVLERAGQVATTDASVLILGESGTGKELVAEAIHENSNRSGAPFVKVNLGGLSTSLFESEMFGHKKGAFTDALKNREGRFTMADGGSIFLDEIGDLDLVSQVKMLRVLQDNTFEVLGSSTTQRVDVRVVSATNRDLLAMVNESDFREDLLYRINLITLTLPPLRERTDDIPLLATQFLHQAIETYNTDDKSIHVDTLAWLQEQQWPGNVRQLKQTIERAVLVARGDSLTAEDCADASASKPGADTPDVVPFVGKVTLDELEKAMVERSLAHFDQNITKVASALGLSRAALYRRLEKHGIKL